MFLLTHHFMIADVPQRLNLGGGQAGILGTAGHKSLRPTVDPAEGNSNIVHVISSPNLEYFQYSAILLTLSTICAKKDGCVAKYTKRCHSEATGRRISRFYRKPESFASLRMTRTCILQRTQIFSPDRHTDRFTPMFNKRNAVNRFPCRNKGNTSQKIVSIFHSADNGFGILRTGCKQKRQQGKSALHMLPLWFGSRCQAISSP